MTSEPEAYFTVGRWRRQQSGVDPGI